MSGTHRDLLFLSKSLCFGSKNNTRVLGPIETINFGANQAVLHAKTTDDVRDQERLVFLLLSTLL